MGDKDVSDKGGDALRNNNYAKEVAVLLKPSE